MVAQVLNTVKEGKTVIEAAKKFLSVGGELVEVKATTERAGEIEKALQKAMATKTSGTRRIVEAKPFEISPEVLAQEQAELAKKQAQIKKLMESNDLELIPTNDVDTFASHAGIAFQHDYNTLSGQPLVNINEARILPHEDVQACFDTPGEKGYLAYIKDKLIGGILVNIDKKTQVNHIDILHVDPDLQNLGFGAQIMKKVEEMFPKTKEWRLFTPQYSKRNIAFYINKMKYMIVKVFDKFHVEKGVNDTIAGNMSPEVGQDFYEFVKKMGV